MEKLQRYRLEKAVQDVNVTNKQWLHEEIKSLLESNKPYQSKCDYIGYSINSIDEKIKIIDEEMKQLKEYKAKLKGAKDITLSVGAEVFESFGISKIEGNGISSITLSSSTRSTKLKITSYTDEDTLISQGFYKKVIDEKKIIETYTSGDYKELLESCCNFQLVETITPSKLRVNKRRASNNTDLSFIDIDAA